MSDPYCVCATGSGLVGVEPCAPVPEDTWASGQALPRPLAPSLFPPASSFVCVRGDGDGDNGVTFTSHVEHAWPMADASTMVPPTPQKGVVERTGVAA